MVLTILGLMLEIQVNTVGPSRFVYLFAVLTRHFSLQLTTAHAYPRNKRLSFVE